MATSVIPILFPVEEPNSKIAPLLCDVQEKIDKLFCRELHFRKIGKPWLILNDQGIRLLNAMYALQNQPEDALVDIIECWFRDRYN